MKVERIALQKFNEYFNLTGTIINFLDIYAYQVIPLFLDP